MPGNHRNKTPKPYRPIIIIGAGRSGTNMLRDILTKLPGFGTWPCDEINYIWRHGNASYPTDELPPEAAPETVQKFIRASFDWLARKYTLSYVVEKTCANSLRVDFVNHIFPEARFIHIIRDGRDVVVSAQKRWTASLDIPYLAKKARFVPLRDLPYYASRYLWNHLYRMISGKRQLAFWGPRFEGFEQVARQSLLAEICAIQWQRCVEKASHDLSKLEPGRVFEIRYEDFVANPIAELVRIGHFLELGISEKALEPLIQDVSPKSVGNWKKQLDQEEMHHILPIIEATLHRYGYV